MKRYLKPLLLLAAVFAVGWTFLVDNFLGKPITPPASYTGKDGYVWSYVEATGKYQLAAASGSLDTAVDSGAFASTTDLRMMAGSGMALSTVLAGSTRTVTVTASGIRRTNMAFSTGTGDVAVFQNGPTVTALTIDDGLGGGSYVSFTDMTVVAAAAGRLQRNGANLSFHDGTAARNLIKDNDSRLTDARTPTAHATSHQNGGGDEVATATPGANAIPKADGSNKLAAGWLSEVLASSDLTDFSSAKTGTGASVVSNTGPTISELALSTYAAFTDQAANAGAAGRLQRNGAELSWHNGTAATNLEQVGRKGAASGYASLDAGTKVPNAQISEVLAFADLTTFGAGNEGEIPYRDGAGWTVLGDGAAYTLPATDADGTGRTQTLLDNNHIAAAAGIAYSKLTLTGAVVVADLATAVVNRLNSATATDGGVVFGNGTNYSTSAAGTSGQVFKSAGTGDPAWADAPMPLVSGGYVTRSGTNLLFSPDVSNRVYCFENSVWVEKAIPDAGITVACTGLSNSTVYHLYVYDNAGTLTLDLSTTVAATTQNGIRVKSGATSRTLIALCRTNGSGAITTHADDAAAGLVCNWYNRRPTRLFKAPGSGYTFARAGGTTARPADNNSANKVDFIASGKDTVTAHYAMYATNGDATVPRLGMDLDGTAALESDYGPFPVSTASTSATVVAHYNSVVSEGYHFLTLMEVLSGTGGTTDPTLNVSGLGGMSVVVFQ